MLPSYFFSISMILRCKASLVANNSRIFVNVLIIWIFTLIALLLCKTLDNIATPCSVNTNGSLLVPPRFDITNCDIKLLNSSLLIAWNNKVFFHNL